MYLLLGIFVTILSFIETSNGKALRNQWYLLVILIFTSLLCLRYGQGTDYYAYFLQFDFIDVSASYMVNALYHGEIGWYVLMLFCKKLGMSFEMFVGVLSLAMMFLIWRSIKKHSPFPLASLLLLFPTYYMTYCNSAMRQGLILCLFLGLGLDLLFFNKYKFYYLLVVGMMLIHKSAFILFTIPLLTRINIKTPFVYIILAGFSSLVLSQASFMHVLSGRFTEGRYMEESFSLGAVVMRLILYYIVIALYRPLSGCDKKLDFMYQMYTWGLIIFMALSFSGTLSQRLSMPFKAIEVILIPCLLYANRMQIFGSAYSLAKTKIMYMFFAVVLLMNTETYKNLNSYIVQGNYRSWVTPISYPYISVFNKGEIWNYIIYFDQY